MARVKFTAAVSEIRGSLGGSTFQANRFGFSLKRKPQQPFPGSQAQEQNKIIMSQVVQTWANLDEATQLLWKAFAVNYPQYPFSGASVALNGFQVFVRFNIFLVQGGLSMITTPGTTFSNSLVGYGILHADGTDLELTVNYAYRNTTDQIAIYASQALPSLSNVSNLRMRRIGIMPASSNHFTFGLSYTKWGNQFPSILGYIAMDFQPFRPETPFLYTANRLFCQFR